jgi:hypothetical protein
MRRGPCIALLFVALFVARTAGARVAADSGYTKAQTYNGALRYLRVDLGYDVTERDADAAYLMFEYSPPGRTTTTRGTVEIVETADNVRIYVQLPQMPEYHERVLSDGLLRKLREEYGAPPEKKPKPPPPAPDGGTTE